MRRRRPAGFTCPDCHRTSYNPSDVADGYCGHCHRRPFIDRDLADAARLEPAHDGHGAPESDGVADDPLKAALRRLDAVERRLDDAGKRLDSIIDRTVGDGR